ncbi:hypothetical protein TSUD_58720 [Trifolium subterraneum]|uniref:Uncharacterized protein n=1 Tax=Trifolium subterraneum TaxID=3900 RepID=A0A2Z6M9L6_TRISU|nr:hypothetical protein TSUD_58720 [Trifolium subterraneum]
MMDLELISNMDPVNIGLGCSENTIPVTSSSIKPRKKTMTSVYLKFFETATDGKTKRGKFVDRPIPLQQPQDLEFQRHI